MLKLFNWFNGKKTIIGIVLGFIYSLLIYLNYVPDNIMVWSALAAYTGIAFKLGLNNLVNCPPKAQEIPINLAPTKYAPPVSPEPPEVLVG